MGAVKFSFRCRRVRPIRYTMCGAKKKNEEKKRSKEIRKRTNLSKARGRDHWRGLPICTNERSVYINYLRGFFFVFVFGKHRIGGDVGDPRDEIVFHNILLSISRRSLWYSGKTSEIIKRRRTEHGQRKFCCVSFVFRPTLNSFLKFFFSNLLF